MLLPELASALEPQSLTRKMLVPPLAPNVLRRGMDAGAYRARAALDRAGFAAREMKAYLWVRAHAGAARPRVASVMVGRNDDYMSDFEERLHATIRWNNNFLIDEVVFVEWNPPKGRELLAAGLTRAFPNLRAYVVPSEIHERICENASVALLEYHAKNVGLRRAVAPWVMATNADTALGFDTIKTVLSTRLRRDVAWTAERYDVEWQEDVQRELKTASALTYHRVIPYHEFGTGEFLLASREVWHRSRGYDEAMVRHRLGCDYRGSAQMQALGVSLHRAGSVLHLRHPSSCTEGIRPHHGAAADLGSLPYRNADTWGLGDARELAIGERIWQLEA